MHEASIVLSVISIVEEEAGKHGVLKVNTITMCVGELSCVEKQTLQACFEIASKSPALEKAELIFEPVKAVLRCDSCGAAFGRENWLENCPECNGSSISIEHGRELYVKNFDAD